MYKYEYNTSEIKLKKFFFFLHITFNFFFTFLTMVVALQRQVSLRNIYLNLFQSDYVSECLLICLSICLSNFFFFFLSIHPCYCTNFSLTRHPSVGLPVMCWSLWELSEINLPVTCWPLWRLSEAKWNQQRHRKDISLSHDCGWSVSGYHIAESIGNTSPILYFLALV